MYQRFDDLSFVDATGVYRSVYGVPLKQRRELRKALAQLERLQSETKLLWIADLYDGHSEFSAIADFCLRLHRIEPDWVNLDMLIQLVLRHRSAAGPRNALLYDLNFPPVPEDGLTSTYTEAIATVWANVGDLEQALRLCGYGLDDDLGWDELVDVMRHRTSPDAVPDSAESQMAEVLLKDLESGAFSFAGARFATDAETQKVMMAL